MQIIPLTSDGARRVAVNLTDTAALITFRTYYNYLAPGWFLDILDEDEVAILTGLALVPNINILRAHPNAAAAIGELRVADLGGDGNTSPESLGNTAYLAHYLPGEFVPAAAPNPAPLVTLESVIV
ncbi:MAG: hypothetical protein JKY94_17800 [Rhodobacteraceae bacterium]|nr:hypothetical protein [Paracoccaceae bacterium]